MRAAIRLVTACLSLSLASGCAARRTDGPAAGAVTVPVGDHHTHLFTAAAIARLYPPPLPAVSVPAELARLLDARASGWSDAAALAGLYAEDAVVFDARGPRWIRGRADVARYMGELFAVPYRITPVGLDVAGDRGHLIGYYAVAEGAGERPFGHVALALRRVDGAWRIASEMPSFTPLKLPRAFTATELIARLDAAGIARALVLSTSYWFASPGGAPLADEQAQVRGEHDWLAGQVAQYPTRLVGFCSLNPLRDYALAELTRCARGGRLRGVKLHFGDSRLDLLDAGHVEAARRLFAAANELRLPIMVHVMTGAASYGRRHSEVFLSRLVTAAPDIPIQVAHLAGSGPGYAGVDPALAVFAEAAAAGDPRMRRVYFDVATIVTLDESRETLALIARRIRQLGPQRVLFGSDYPASPELTPKNLWAALRTLPLTDAELRTIAGNVPPYMQ